MKHFFQIQMMFGKRKSLLFLSFLLCSLLSFSQEKEKHTPEEKQAQSRLQHAQKALDREKFSEAEADYRKAISLDKKNNTARYNLGTAYYDKNRNNEAMFRFKQAAKTAKTKEEKHRAFHNLGNTFMNAKQYQEAVEAYKNALRNNPTDDETRYNLALAKDLLEKNPPPPDEQNEDDENQDQNQNEDQNQQDQDQSDGEDDDENEDQDQGEDEEDEGDEGDEDQQDGQPDQPEDDPSDAQQTPPGQLSPEQIESLLEAMENEEKKVQEKMNAEKQKGIKIESDKYW